MAQLSGRLGRTCIVSGVLVWVLSVLAVAEDISVHYQGYGHKAAYGHSVTVEMSVRNNSTEPTADVHLAASGPPGWRARLEPDLLRSIAPHRGTETFRLIVQPPRSPFEHQGWFTVEARTAGLSASARVLITGMPPRLLWPGVGIALSLAAAAVFVLLFRRSTEQR